MKEEDDSIFAQEQVLQLRLALRQKTKLDMTNPSGECLYCGEHIGHDRRWCQDDIQGNGIVFSCRDAYVKEQKHKQNF